MYYPCSESKGADQLRGYREADLRLCFRIGKNPVFSRCGSFGGGFAGTKFKLLDLACSCKDVKIIVFPELCRKG